MQRTSICLYSFMSSANFYLFIFIYVYCDTLVLRVVFTGSASAGCLLLVYLNIDAVYIEAATVPARSSNVYLRMT